VRELRSSIAHVDGHGLSEKAGTDVYQGRGVFVGPNLIKVSDGTILEFDKAVIATGGRPSPPPSIPGLADAPYTTNESLFNLQTLPQNMVVLGAGVIALEMAYAFANMGSKVTVIQRSSRLFESQQGDAEAADIITSELKKVGVTFLSNAQLTSVETLRQAGDPTNMDSSNELPLMKLSIQSLETTTTLDCDCLLVALGRLPNIENLGLEAAGITATVGKGVHINDYAQCEGNSNVYAVGDCVMGVPRLTHVSGEMAKLVVQNALFGDDWMWKVSSLVVPAVMYTEPEYATVGIYSKELADKKGIEVDVWRTSLEDNDRGIVEEKNVGVVVVVCKQGTDEILGATIVAERAGEMINEVTLAIKHNIGLRGIGRNIHAYPTIGEAVMTCGVQLINSQWPRFERKKKEQKE
jgi:pyruvate/2-oxoglutarate dehydrogenase complex dihydrolipoamide dehydrogenase (E3) component